MIAKFDSSRCSRGCRCIIGVSASVRGSATCAGVGADWVRMVEGSRHCELVDDTECCVDAEVDGVCLVVLMSREASLMVLAAEFSEAGDGLHRTERDSLQWHGRGRVDRQLPAGF